MRAIAVAKPYARRILWGGTKLSKALGVPEIEGDLPVAESLEVSCLPEMPSRLRDHDGTLLEMVRQAPKDWLGPDATAETTFPILVKRLDVGLPLSVQVHPDDASALLLDGEPNGKEEAWVILDVDERSGSHVLLGFDENISSEDVLSVLGTDGVVAKLRSVEVRPGDVVPVPGGCAHAIQPGLLLLEAQQSSDLTYRIWDYDRTVRGGVRRELHVEKAKAAVKPELRPAVITAPDQEGRVPLVQMVPFRMERWRTGTMLLLNDAPGLVVLHAFKGQGTVDVGGEPVSLEEGETAIIGVGDESIRVTAESDDDFALYAMLTD